MARIKSPLYQMLDTIGDGSGETEMAGAPCVYKISPQVGDVYQQINILNIYIKFTGEAHSARYGKKRRLSNGIVVSIYNDLEGLCILTPTPITEIYQWGLQAGTSMYLSNTSDGVTVFVVRWQICNDSTAPIILDRASGKYIRFDVRDNLGLGGADLISHCVQAQGFIFKGYFRE